MLLDALREFCTRVAALRGAVAGFDLAEGGEALLVPAAQDDVILYLDTHPDDRNALNYYRYVVALRKEAVKAYEASFGPLTIEDADDACTWSWLTERWPWEGEV